jgi:Tfp pilus assembly protein PilE
MNEQSTELSIHRSTGAWAWIRQNVLVIVGILSVIGSSTYFIITFYIRSSDSWQVIKGLQEDIRTLKEKKADQATVDANQKSINDRLQRQYEGNNTRDSRITEIEKQAAYDRGRHDAEQKK